MIFFLFVSCTNICNYADDTTIFACHPTLETIIRKLETDGTFIAKWFSDNYFKLNDDKCHLMIFGDKCSKATVAIRRLTIQARPPGRSAVESFYCNYIFKLLTK